MSVDDGAVRAVRVNGRPARPLAADFSRWEVELDLHDSPSGPAAATVIAEAVDDAGNIETVPHRVAIVDVARPAAGGIR